MPFSSSQASQLKDFLTNTATSKGDLSNVTAPPFVFARKSAVEIPAAWCLNQPLFLAQSRPTDPALRALAVLKSYLCSVKAQTYIGMSEEEGAKKPLNAFLGELFLAEVGDSSDPTQITRVVAEQVSHHPPVTAAYIYNEAAGIRTDAYFSQKTTYALSYGMRVEQVGHASLHLDKWDEDYVVTLPTMTVKNILSGSPYPELSGTCYVVSTSGFTSKIDFSGKKMLGLSGKKNSLHAEVCRSDAMGDALYTVDGQWSEEFVVRDCTNKKEMETIKVGALNADGLRVKPIAQQDHWESRRAWANVLEAADSGDTTKLAQEKDLIEEGQRLLRRMEEEKGVAFERVFYQREEDDAVARKLLKQVGESLNETETDGVWKFKGVDHACQVQSPYHPDILPTGPVQTNKQ